jgi:hypothetical protein
MSIEVNNISKSYGAKALDNISFSVKKEKSLVSWDEWSWKIYFNENTNDLYC